MPMRIVVYAAAALLFAGGIWLGTELRPDRPGSIAAPTTIATQVATVLNQPRDLPDFTLQAAGGGDYSGADLGGHWTLLFMGFTNCGHICPTTLATLDQAVHQSGAPVDVLFVSVDPGRDRPEVIRTYLDGFNPEFSGATGDQAQIDTLAAALGAPYRVSQDDGRYLVDHSTAVFLINPNGQFQAVFSAPHNAEAIAGDLRTILESLS